MYWVKKPRKLFWSKISRRVSCGGCDGMEWGEWQAMMVVELKKKKAYILQKLTGTGWM